MVKWLKHIGVCKDVERLKPVDFATAHADISMAVAGPHSYLVSYDPKGEAPNGATNFEIVKKKAQTDGPEVGGLPYSSHMSKGGDVEPSSYANALVVNGPGGIYLVFPRYDSIYYLPEDPVHIWAKDMSKKAWLEALEAAYKEKINIIEVDAGGLLKSQGSIHCATKNYPVSAVNPLNT